MNLFREIFETKKTALVSDFREFYHISAYSVFSGDIDLKEAVDLILGLMSNPASRMYASVNRIPRYSFADRMLTGVYNAIIASSHASKAEKSKLYVKLPAPNPEQEKKQTFTREEAKTIFKGFKIKGVENVWEQEGETK